MKQETKRRIKSAALAVMMVVASAPITKISPVVTAYAAPNIRFNTNIVSNDPAKGEVITGRQVEIRESNAGGAVSDMIVLRSDKGHQEIQSDPDTVNGSTNAAVDIFRDNDIWKITFRESFDLSTGEPETDAEKGQAKYKLATDNYAVRAVYKQFTTKGEANEIAPNQNPDDPAGVSIIDVTSNETLEIMAESKIILECIRGEDEEGGLAFQINHPKDATEEEKKKPATGTEVFEGYTSAIYRDNLSTPPAEGFTMVTKPKRTVVIGLRGGSLLLDLSLDVSGTSPDYNDDGTLKGTRNNFIKRGTIFEVAYYPTYSNPIMLNVMTPQYVMNELENLIGSSDGVDNRSAIRLASGNRLQRIDQNFYVLAESNLHHGYFTLDWDWGDLTDSENIKDGAKPMESPPNPATDKGWKPIEIKREKEDKSGKVIVTVTYHDSGDNETKSKTATEKDEDGTVGGNLPTKNITIRGIGIPGDVTQYSYRKGTQTHALTNNDPYISFPANQTALPNSQLDEYVSLDAYRGGISAFNQAPVGYYDYVLKLNMGAMNSTVTYAEVKVVAPNNHPEYADFVELWADTGEGMKRLAANGRLDNPKATSVDQSNASIFYVKVVAKEQPTDKEPVTADMDLQITYWVPDGADVLGPTVYTVPLKVNDSNPNQNSKLVSLEIFDADNPTGDPIPFTVPFEPDRREYLGESAVAIPFAIKNIKIRATLQDRRGARRPIAFRLLNDNNDVENIASWVADSGNGIDRFLWHGQLSEKTISLVSKDDPNGMKTLERMYTLQIVSPSQHPDKTTTYRVQFYRARPSTDNKLASLEVYVEDTDGADPTKNQIENFDPKEEIYDIWIPYSTKTLRVKAAKSNAQAVLGDLEITDLPNYKLEGENPGDKTKELLHEVKERFKELPEKPTQPPKGSGVPDLEPGVMELKYTVTSEEGWVTNQGGKKTYRVRIHRNPPKDDALISAFEVYNGNEGEQETVLPYEPAFSPDTKTYTLTIPYSIKKIKFNITTNDPNVDEVELWQTKVGSGDDNKLLWLTSSNTNTLLKLGTTTKGIDVQDITTDYVKNNQGYHPFYIKVVPEKGPLGTIQQYLLRVIREEPSHDATLKDLVLQDQDNGEIKNFSLREYEDDEKNVNNRIYHLTVPYKTTGVSFTPTTNHQYATMEIAEELLGEIMSPIKREIKSGAQSKVYNLKDKPLEEKKFQIIVTPEDGKAENQVIYTIYIQREEPSHDARLKALKTENTSNFKPLFISSKTDYSADVNEGAPGVIITPTANHPNATIKVDGVVVESGSPTDLIELLEIKQTVRIEVIAEDGVTRMVYKIEFTNQNLIEKTSNADLKRLAVNYGLMTPEFQSAVTEYEVTAKETTWSVDIIPRLADQYATMRVLNGTKELGDYNGNYALALADGENNVTIEVTSPDKTVTKNYDVTIYRNDEEKLKNLEPLEAEDINFEQVGNPIIVKIEEYPRVGASVFNTIREEYPDRSIVFQGNDYSIRFDGKNLTRVIPQTEIYDFRMTFDSPDEEAIYDLIGERSANDDIIDDAVLCYFDYHGSLPGPATFSLSLGRRYANDTLYWHYYNKERERIDYYGSLNSNSKGNVAVSIDHFSTYIVTPEHRIAGSEDKDGIIDELGMVSNGQDLLGSGGKLNPDTGVKEAP